MLFIMVTCCLYNDNSNKNTLNEIEEYIQDNPQKAYGELSKIDRSSLHGNKERALFFLLYSMALDKNYVDIASDSLINRSVEYYSRHGDKLHRFYAYYCLGRVHINAQEYDKALAAFIKAERCSDKTISDDYLARLHYNKSNVYRHHFAEDKAMDEAIKAKEIALRLDNPAFYISYSLNVAKQLFVNDMHEDAGNSLKELRSWMIAKGIKPTLPFYRVSLRQSLDNDVSQDSLAIIFHLYAVACEESNKEIEAPLATDYYIKMKEYEKAEEAFNRIPKPASGNYYEALTYYSLLSSLCEVLGRWDEYRAAQQEYQKAVESINLSVFNNDVRFLEERNNNEAEKEQSRKDRVILVIVLLMVLGASGGIGAMLYNKFKKSKRQLEDIRKEYNLITNIFNQTSLDTPESIRNVLDARIKALRPFITNVKFPLPKGRRILESIDDERRKMLTSIGMLYALSYPAFTTKLSQIGLRSEEIGLCSLYVCGYSSKEMNDLLNKTDIYHLNSGIRNKIGDEIGSKTLHIWLKELFHSCNS